MFVGFGPFFNNVVQKPEFMVYKSYSFYIFFIQLLKLLMIYFADFKMRFYKSKNRKVQSIGTDEQTTKAYWK